MASLILHSAHQPGLNTCLAFSQDGLTLHTGGEDGLVRTWPLDLGSGKEPELADEADEAITSLTTSKTYWLSASLDSCVRKYDAHGTTMEGLVTRSVAVPVRCVALDPKGERAAVASDELEVKVISLSDITNIKILEGHRKGVRKVTWHPSGTLLATCGGEGDIIVWDVSLNEEPKQIATISGILQAVDIESSEFSHDCSAVWHPSGRYFVVSSRTHELVVISRDKWQKTAVFSDDDITGAITALSISPNGAYLASAYQSGIFIWSTATRKVLFRHVPTSPSPQILQLVFSPTQNLLAWTDAEGNLVRWPDPIPSSSPDPVNAFSTSSNLNGPSTKKSGSLRLDEVHKGAGKDDTREVDEDYEMDDDWMIDDIGLLDKAGKENDLKENTFAREMVSVTKAQPPFQPASTPMVNKKRYLAYNMIGVIEVTDQDTHHVVNLDFHDRSTRAGSHFQDTLRFNLASLGERGAVYACPPEGGHPAQIVYKPYSGWAASGEWQYLLPVGEEVIALAAGGSPPSGSLRDQSYGDSLHGNGNAVAATNRGYLRFFTGGGMQRYVWALGGDVVSMVAGREWVFVVHRDGGTSLDGCQNLSYLLISWETFDAVQRGQLPLPRATILRWIGISEEGAPAMYDSAGILSILDRFRRPSQARWIPILDTTTLARRKGKDESYWPVGISASLYFCLILKGREDYPGFPRPLVQELEVQIPLLDLGSSQGQMEERFLREEIHIDMLRDALGSGLTDQEISRRELGVDKELIQLIQLACKSDKLQRAVDIAALLHNKSSLEMAVKVAQFYHLTGLQEKITAIKSDRSDAETKRRHKWRQPSPIPVPLPSAQGLPGRRQAEDFARTVRVGKSLAPAVPIVNGTDALQGTMCDSSSPQPSVPLSETEASQWGESEVKGKRKREEASVEDDADADNSSNNPFVRKARENGNNPFSRPGKEKEKKGTSRQTTLFGLPLGVAPKKGSRQADERTFSPGEPDSQTL